MASYLSNMTPIYSPFSSDNSISCFNCPPLSTTKNRTLLRNVKAMAAGTGRDNLDHLQRLTKQPKRSAQVTPIVICDRFPTARTVKQMMDTMERMVEDPLAYTNTTRPTLSAREGDGYGRGRTPWAIKEGEKDYKIRFDMPGMTKNDVNVWVEENMLVVKAEKLTKKQQEGQATDHEENEEEWPAKSFGRYSTRIALPDNIEFEKIKAEVKEGVLYITVPKAITASKIFDIDVQ